MKLHKKHANIERGGVKTESTFTIKTTAKSFEILSSGLYTDPITAIIRELSCNAYDAHIEANKSDVPFDIHLPNKLEPFFSVTDYGVGLSDDQIQGKRDVIMFNEHGVMLPMTDVNGNFMYERTGGLYTTYFDSTKTDSNDYIGALGLGSKSPFSYADAFDVTSRHDGIKSMYSIFLNEEGIPSVALLGQIETSESNGLEVRITIKEEDFNTFENKTASILRYFPVPPTVTGVHNFKFVQFPTHRLSGDGWFVANKNWNTESFTAVQGNVPYRVNVSQLATDLSAEEAQFLGKATVVAFFDIGELDVAANREEIRYDKRTKEALISKMRQVRKDLTIKIEEHADEHRDSFWDACIELDGLSNELFGTAGSIRTFAKQDNSTNQTLKQYIESNGVVTFNSLRQHDLVRYTASTSWKSTRQHTSRRRVVGTIEPSHKTAIFYNDVRVGGIGRVKEFLHESNQYKDAIIISQFKSPITINTLSVTNNMVGPVMEFNVATELKELLDDIGSPAVLIVSLDTTAKIRQKTKNIPMFKYGGTIAVNRGYYDTSERVNWDKLDISEVSLDKGGLYFSLKRSTQITSLDQHINWSADNVGLNFNRMLKAINDANGTNFTSDDLYGVSASAMRRIKKEEDWSDVFELFRKTLTNYSSSVQYLNNMDTTPNVYGVKDFITNNTFIEYTMQLDVNSPFRKCVEPMIEHAKLHKNDIDIAKFVKHFTLLFDNSLITSEEKYIGYENFNDYPMLRIIGSFTNCQNDWGILFDYITQIDRS